MEAENNTEAPRFFLLGLSDDPALQPLLFGLFLSMYLLTVLGNALIVLAVGSAPHLHTPMYFFLANLSLADICFTSTTVPKMLANLQAQSKAISYVGCLTQVYCFLIFVGVDNLLLTAMAYDRFVAICHPLHYSAIMSPQLCVLLLLVSWAVMFWVALLHVLLTMQLSFCTGTEIPHFFCELTEVLKAACSDTLVNNICLYVSTALLGVLPLTGILCSYSQIASSVMKMSSSTGKQKAFSTCGSHLCVVSLFYGTGLGVYLSSAVTHSSERSSVASVMYTVVTPMLNPFIYSLRNKDVKAAVRRLFSRGTSCPLWETPRHMETGNLSGASQFLLLGLSDDPALQPLLFGLFLSMYLLTVLGNTLIILAVGSTPHLHMPMYFFLANLSLADICFTSTTVPKMLANLQAQNKGISYAGCLTQVYLFMIFAGLDNFLLTVMAYDRFVAICHPLHYTAIMSPQLCVLLVLLCWLVIFWVALLHILLITQLTFCASTEIPHFFCELAQILKVACSDTLIVNICMYVFTALLVVFPAAGILYSYSQIVSSVMKMSSSTGKQKAFSTCGSHLCVVCLFYGTGLGVYLSSAVTHSSERSSVASVMYTVVTPMLNPFIYSLRNKDLVVGRTPLLLPQETPRHMETGNLSGASQFLLLGLSDDPALQPLLFGLFLSMYLLTVLGNALIVLAVGSAPHLHTPMYFFVSNLSFVDICVTSIIIPKMLANLQAQSKAISYIECLTQMFFAIIFVGLDTLLLTVMAYDRFVAICHPLHYTAIMSPQLCVLLVLLCWFFVFWVALVLVLLVAQLTFCTGTEIPHFFCELAQILKVACSDTLIVNICLYAFTALVAVFPLTGILYSYSQIASSVMKMSSSTGKQKAFSTCGSHLCVVSLFYGTGLGVYLSSAVTHSSERSSVASVMYTVVTPMLNPFIYSLRNKDNIWSSFELVDGQIPLLLPQETPRHMETGNLSGASQFLLLGLSDDPALQPLLFGLFLSMYLLTVLGNALIVLAVGSAPHLHTPMYFFLANLSLADICFTSTTVPKMLANLQAQNKGISYVGCLTQVYLFVIFAGLDTLLLTVMAYDRFVAICHPLHYTAIMSPRVCVLLVLLCWFFIFWDALVHVLLITQLTFCASTEIPHFFCELAQILKVACSDTFINSIYLYVTSALLGFFPAAGILYSYSQIVSSVMKMSSSTGKQRAFSTCGSHLCVVSLFYGTGLGVYLSSSGTYSSERSSVASVMYTVVTPMLNPFIYSMRNKDSKIRFTFLEHLIFQLVDGRTPLLLPQETPCHMETGNLSGASQFLLLGLSDDPALQPLLFGLFLSMYLLTVLGNALIVLAVGSAPHLHTPMYFFLANLSLADICFTSTTVPKMLANLQAQNKGISYAGCLTQVYLFMIFAGLDNFLLTVMAYDRFVAICHPLHYTAIMNPQLCVLLVLTCWLIIFWVALVHILLIVQMKFHIGTEIPHFFCELAQILKVACSDTLINNIFLYVFTALLVVFPAAGILYSYSQIASSVMKMSSSTGKQKAFSTCGSHLCVVCLFYGTGLGVYLSSAVTHSSERSSVASVMYTVVTPMLNPFIYSLRNKDVKAALGKLLSRAASYAPCGSPVHAAHRPLHSRAHGSFCPLSLTPIFCLFLSMYLVALTGNLLIVLAISSDAHLHTPIYFFLAILSVADVGFTSATIPKMISDICTQSRVISPTGCLVQHFFSFGCVDSTLPTMMAYDRFVAICRPLHYSVTMCLCLCGLLVLASVWASLLDAQLHCVMLSQLTFCPHVDVPHFFCDPPQLLKLACSDTSLHTILMNFIRAIFGGVPVSGILFSYTKIVSSVLRVPSTRGRHKAFSTCGSHLSVVCLFYGTAIGVYLSLAVSRSPRQGAVASVVYTPEEQGHQEGPAEASQQKSLISGPASCLLLPGTRRVQRPRAIPCNFLDTFLFLSPILLIVLAVGSAPHLHTPMYFFLANLSLADICFTSMTIPKLLVNLQAQSKAISYVGCLTQVYFFLVFAGLDNLLLAAMAYDRFVAICHPLHYTAIMSPQLCVLLVSLCWLVIFWASMFHVLLLMRLTFCTDTEIPNFFYPQGGLSDTFVNNLCLYVATALLGVFPFTGILCSYSQIVSSLMKMSSSTGKQRAFSTCGSHLCVVSLFYGTALGVYLTSAVPHTSKRSLIASVMYTVVTPMLNPFIYSLRNRDVKGAFAGLLRRAAARH
ncbi:LOW QUALITY PROTEIN: Olfactory receptor 7D4 [Galemys pyrenaicus]|uniref:Olfactory receptor 7D4 n=1 Tax=Galemys pyrenaicus TaxID=202257 RepID=A0A8J6ADX9_GALPY|nr:LOW QUALITY PROTEIN: Olfactory receptor 7D4 [Galemys pyrenaicus]